MHRNSLAIALLVSAKVFGIVGLVLGSTQYRPVGGALLAFDAVLLVAAVVTVLRDGNAAVKVEKDQKAVLRQMVAEGTLAQYLVDIRTDSAEAAE